MKSLNKKSIFVKSTVQLWSATVSVERLGEITVYAHRLGDGYISEAEYQFDGVTMTAIEYRYYREINSLFYANQTYFLYE